MRNRLRPGIFEAGRQRIAAYFQIAFSIAIGELYAIYLDPQCWGQGLGRKLLAHATRRLLSHGYSIAILWVLESNRRARRFYEIAGWTLDGATKLENIPDGIELREVSYQISFSREEEE
jgi:GNAT superfamily N-acetyltransferase